MLNPNNLALRSPRHDDKQPNLDLACRGEDIACFVNSQRTFSEPRPGWTDSVVVTKIEGIR